MGQKEQISKSYIENWHQLTQDYLLPEVRHALVVGSDEQENIGAGIAGLLRSSGDFITVEERDIDTLDLGNSTDVRNYPWSNHDTVVFANGQTNLAWIEDQTYSAIESVLVNKLMGTIFGVREFVKRTINFPVTKNIVMIGSMAAGSVLNGSSVYCAACAGLQHFARCVAWELAPKGYRVFLLNPSNVEGTPMTEATIEGLMEYRGLDREQAEEYWGAVRALPRWLKAGEIATIAHWLVTTPEAEWLSGVPLNLGGGLR